MVRPEPKIDMLKPIEALQHQSARNQKSHRDRNLRDDENIEPSACAQRASQCEFACARNAARQLKIRHVCATNEQEKYHTGHKREERFANVAGQIAEQFLP